jgi:hypothetical protein
MNSPVQIQEPLAHTGPESSQAFGIQAITVELLLCN